MDEIYRNMSLENIQWNIKTPPGVLVDLLANEILQPCKTIDLGCGIGNYALYLATLGFDVTGIDISGIAINLAKENSKNKGVDICFQTANLLGDLDKFRDTFDFAYDWEVLHHIFPEHRKKYVQNVYQLLKPKGKYLSVCFSEKDKQFGGVGKFRKTRLGTVLYFSSENELKDLFKPYFKIKELKTIEIQGKTDFHQAVYAYMERKNTSNGRFIS